MSSEFYDIGTNWSAAAAPGTGNTTVNASGTVYLNTGATLIANTIQYTNGGTLTPGGAARADATGRSAASARLSRVAVGRVRVGRSVGGRCQAYCSKSTITRPTP